MKPRFKLKLVDTPRPLHPLTLAEKRAAVGRDFSTEPWIRGEGAKFFTVERVAVLKAQNEALRNKRRGK